MEEERKSIIFELDWRAAVAAWIFIVTGALMAMIGVYAFVSSETPAQLVYWFASLVFAGFVGWKLHGARPAKEIHHETPAAAQQPMVTEGEWRPAPRQLAKRSVAAADLALIAAPETIWDLNDQGERIEVDRKALEHFLDVCWPAPKRDERWKMASEDYAEVAAFLCGISKHPLLKKGRAYVWAPSIQRDHLLRWLDQTINQAQF